MKKKDNEGKTLYAIDEGDEDAFLTPWSWVHYLSGAAMKGLGLSFPVAFLVHGAYEMKDRAEHDEVYNSQFNSLGDQTVAMLGWYWTKDTNSMRWTYYWLLSWAIAAGLRDQIG